MEKSAQPEKSGPSNSDEAVPRRPAKLFSTSDVRLLLQLPVMALIAWCTPTAVWPSCAVLLARCRAILKTTSRAARVNKIARTLGTRQLAASPEQIVQDMDAVGLEGTLHILRHYRPGRWDPPMTVTGQAHIDAGLEKGNGVVLWVADFAFHALVLKMALHRAGYAVSHLSGPRHGFSTSHFGMRFLNPIRTTIESRFLRERVVMSDLALPEQRRVAAAMRTLLKRLKKNGVVSVSALPNDTAPDQMPLFDGTVRLPSGAPGLAYQSGAALLPVFAVRNAQGTYEIIIEPPIAPHEASTRKAAVTEAIATYCALLQDYVTRYPGQWNGWHNVIAPGNDDGKT